MGTHLQDLLHRHQPDLIALTETLYSGEQKHLPGSVKGALQGYHFVHTPAAPSTIEADRPTGGILLGVRRRMVTGAGLSFSQGFPTGDALQGRHARLTITAQGRNLNIQAVYMPAGTTPEDVATRETLYRHIKQHLQRGAGANIVLGDMNAALLASDRSHPLYPRDIRHQHAAAAMKLRPFEAADIGSRDRTYRNPEGLVSRIDDVLTTCPAAQLEEWRPHITVTTDVMEGNDTDHDALIVRVPWETLGLEPPCQPGPQSHGPASQRLKTPMSAIDKACLERTLEAQQGPQWAALLADLEIAAEDLANHYIAKAAGSPEQPIKLQSLQSGGTRQSAVVCIEGGGHRPQN